MDREQIYPIRSRYVKLQLTWFDIGTETFALPDNFLATPKSDPALNIYYYTYILKSARTSYPFYNANHYPLQRISPEVAI